jgi:phosphatidylinositol alpha-mannosyltransferase
MGKLKIGFVLDDTLDTPDGVQQYILTLGNWLRAQGHDVHYLVGATKRTDIPNVHVLSRNIRVRFNGNRMSTPLPASQRKIRQVLTTEKFDILHVQMPYSPFMAQQIIKHAGPATAIMGTFHIAPHDNGVRRANKLLSKLLTSSLTRFSGIFSVSQAAADFAKHTYGIESTILPNVVEVERYLHAAPIVDSTPDEVPRLVFVGRLVPRKGCQVLLKAVKILKDDLPETPFELVICGKGPLDAELKRYCDENQLHDRVRFAGFVTEEQKASYLKAADIAVFPSTGGESFGIVLIEAMAAEHPVVLGADNEGYHTVLAPHPESLFPAAAPEALAHKLKQYLSDAVSRQEALVWQKMYIRQFDVEVVGPRLVARYGEALRSKRDLR